MSGLMSNDNMTGMKNYWRSIKGMGMATMPEKDNSI